MKVALLGPAYPLRGGIADFNEALALAMQENGIHVSIFSFYYQYPKILFPGTSQITNTPKPEQLEIHSSLSSINPLSWRKTAKKIIDLNPDFVIVRYWLPFMAMALGSVCKMLRKKNIPVIAITDNVIPHEHRPGDQFLTKFFVRQCNGFITMSKEVMNQLEQFTRTAKKIFLPHPIYHIFGKRITKEEARINLNLPVEEKIILFFGFIRAYKGLGILLDAMAHEAVQQRKIKLLVAGEFYEDSKPYLEQIEKNGLADSVILHTAFISKEKVRDYFCAADLVIQPYLSATQSGITQIAYNFGRPMLVTNVGGLSEIVTNNRVGYVTEKDPIAIANAICDFYDNHREKIFSVNADIDKENFSWNNFINGIFKLYESVK